MHHTRKHCYVSYIKRIIKNVVQGSILKYDLSKCGDHLQNPTFKLKP
jgi:hypothetical protein